MMTETIARTKTKLKLAGTDGNAFALLAAALRAAKAEKWSQEQIDRFKAEATKGDYAQLLRALQTYFEVE